MKNVGILFPDRVEDMGELCQQEESFRIAVDKELGGNGAVKHHGSRHLPVGDYLAEIGVVGICGVLRRLRRSLRR